MSVANARTAPELIEMIRGRGIHLPSLLPYCSLVTTDKTDQDGLVTFISRSIATMGMPRLVHEFTRAVHEVEGTAIGSTLAAVAPDVRPVMRLKVCTSHTSIHCSGSHIIAPRKCSIRGESNGRWKI